MKMVGMEGDMAMLHRAAFVIPAGLAFFKGDCGDGWRHWGLVRFVLRRAAELGNPLFLFSTATANSFRNDARLYYPLLKIKNRMPAITAESLY
jgi:hypothetical protein